MFDSDVMLSVKSGFSRTKVEPIYGIPVDPDEVFGTLENDRKNETLSGYVTSAATHYKALSKHPGYLERSSSKATSQPVGFRAASLSS
ncbi:MAG: hypothetical protein KF908_02830 [Nitrosomonas sp.]|nr:hypothetical protein [Nitrosomonas sp.]